MVNGIWFGDIHSYENLNLILSKVDLPPAAVKETFVDNPGGDGSWDLTEANGKVNYKNRTAKFTFSVLPQDDFEAKKTEVSNLLNGRRFKITLDKDPEYYWDGRCSVNQYSSNKKKRQIVVGANVAPYKLKQEQTRVFVPFCGRNLFNNAELPKIGGSSANIESIATGVRATWVQGKSAYVLVKWLPLDMLIGETITLSCDIVESGGAKGTIQIGYAAANGSPRQSKVKLESTGAVSFTVEKTNPQFEYLAIWFYANNGTDPANVTAGAYVDYLNVQIELGEVSKEDLFSKNLLVYPFKHTTKTENGITFTDNGNGIITANGTATADAIFTTNTFTVKANQNYFLSGCPKGGSDSTYYLRPRGFSFDIGNGRLVRNSTDFSNDVEIVIKNGVTANNLVFKPMFNEGYTALPYEPYWRGYEAYVPYRGKNLFDYETLLTSKSWEKQSDGSFYNNGRVINETVWTNTNGKRGSMYLSDTLKVVSGTPFYLYIVYTDGSKEAKLGTGSISQVGAFETLTYTTPANKTVDYIQWTYGSGGQFYVKDVMFSFVDGEYEAFNAPANITLANGRKTVVPTLICTTETKFDVDGMAFTLSEGKHKVLDFQLTEGETNVSLHGEDGAAAIVYQEGDL